MDNKALIFFISVLILAAAITAHNNPNPSGGSLFGNRSGNTSSGSSNPQDTIDRAQNQADEIQKQIDAEKARQEASTLAADVDFNSGSAWSSNPASEYVYFTLDRNHVGNVLITGFTLQSTASGRTAKIGEGVPLVFGGQINSTQPIYISPGDRVYVSTGPSPLGYSFATNKCSGYLAQNQTFNPSIQRNCPLAEDEPQPLAPNNLSDECLDRLNNISRCTMPDPSSLPHATLGDAQCYNFIIDHLNYNSCVNAHKNDRDFNGHEWHVYLGYSTELWKSRREIIKLLDQSGKTIGTVTY